MATVHPSRMGLVPQDRKDAYDTERRHPRSRSKRYSDRGRERGRERHGEGPDGYSRGRNKQRSRSGERPRSFSRHQDGRDMERQSENQDRRETRRASPEYSDYKRPPSPGQAAPWRQQENMYPPRHYRDRPPHGYGIQSTDYLESRRLQREASTVSIWPPSPKRPARQLSPVGSSRRKSKRDRPETSSDLDTDSESEYDRRRRERKERKRRKHREKTEKKGRKHERPRSYEGSGDDVDRRPRKSRSKSKSQQPRSPSPSRTPSTPAGSEEEEWVEKPITASIISSSQSKNNMPPPATIPTRMGTAPTSTFVNLDTGAKDDDDDSGEEVGPQPLIKVNTTKKVDERAYGSALLRGEGSAMAAFLQDSTDTRIPRRGEIGLTSDEIASFEAVGYVMSGSRHKRMNAVRMRKENQVISAEEKRGILKLQREERARRETILREEFSELVHEKLKAPEAKPRQ
ncbi:ras-induced vulval development antagonist-domain-containing protein [Pisolithus orientalis]|uniref:ras-induced vulval development antagonist-domain-containing protein n=1 Tax=Pisolithus orientalis TaxID=936130 RepID=UPI002225A8DE|nr:ras-induced vulval development antagonist-domain-containing protein [Pisolithus orientalis]KAI6032994.1 ras-induced vulval development antagonist-domain-containing protein [Pisolithus orientalis]